MADASFSIRAGEQADHAKLLEIWLRSVKVSHTFLTAADIDQLYPLVRDQALPALELWALDQAGTTVGFMGLDGNKLEALFLDPDVTGKGGGRLLVDYARQRKGPLLVDVNEQNPEALKFYQSVGFELIGRSEVDGGGRPFPLLHLKDTKLPA